MNARLMHSTPFAVGLAVATFLSAWTTRDWCARESGRAESTHQLTAECERLVTDIAAGRQTPDGETEALDRDTLLDLIRSAPGAPRLDRITGRQARRGDVQVRQIEASLTDATIPAVQDILARVVEEYPTARIDSVACALSTPADGWDVTLIINVGIEPKGS